MRVRCSYYSLDSIFFKSNIQYMVRTVTVGDWTINVNYLSTAKQFECSISNVLSLTNGFVLYHKTFRHFFNLIKFSCACI